MFTGKKGYVALTEEEARDALGDPHSIDQFVERFSERPEAADYVSFSKNLVAKLDSNPARFGVVRLFATRPPLLVGVGTVANAAHAMNAVYGSPALGHKNAGRKALARLRREMLGEALLRRARHVAMLASNSGPQKADRLALAQECALSFNLAEIPPDIRGEALKLLRGAPHEIAHLDTRQAPRAPISEARTWTAEIAPSFKFGTPVAPMEVTFPIRFGQRTEKGFAARDLVNFEDDVDILDTERTPALLAPAQKTG
ncbi:MAG: hypothetical protein WDM79_18710 [Terricaulis sp.]